MSTSIQALRLRTVLAAAPRSGVGHSYPAALREQVVRFAREQGAQGLTVAAIAADVGLPTTTLKRWLGSPPPTAVVPLRAVLVADDPAPASNADPLVLLLPGGTRVEGLSFEHVLQLVRSRGS